MNTQPSQRLMALIATACDGVHISISECLRELDKHDLVADLETNEDPSALLKQFAEALAATKNKPMTGRDLMRLTERHHAPWTLSADELQDMAQRVRLGIVE